MWISEPEAGQKWYRADPWCIDGWLAISLLDAAVGYARAMPVGQQCSVSSAGCQHIDFVVVQHRAGWAAYR